MLILLLKRKKNLDIIFDNKYEKNQKKKARMRLLSFTKLSSCSDFWDSG